MISSGIVLLRISRIKFLTGYYELRPLYKYFICKRLS